MPDVTERYCLRESAGTLSIKPHAYLARQACWLLLAAIVIAIAALAASGLIREDIRITIHVLSAYLALHGLYDIIFKANIRYTFDGPANAVFKNSLIHPNKKIMRLDEALIFITEVTAAWHYALGARKSQFVKSHTISEQFGSGPKSQKRQQTYEEHILQKIHILIDMHIPTHT